MNLICDCCLKRLTELGGLLFSPPKSYDVQKFHICVDCYEKTFFPLVRNQIYNLLKTSNDILWNEFCAKRTLYPELPKDITFEDFKKYKREKYEKIPINNPL